MPEPFCFPPFSEPFSGTYTPTFPENGRDHAAYALHTPLPPELHTPLPPETTLRGLWGQGASDDPLGIADKVAVCQLEVPSSNL
jgi:hypothetical protein